MSSVVNRGLVLGVYDPVTESGKGDENDVQGSAAFQEINGKLKGLLAKNLIKTGYFDKKVKAGKARVFHGLDETYSTIVVVGLGSKSAGFNEQEQWDEGKENVRIAAGAAIRQLQEVCCSEAEMDSLGDAQAAAEGAFLQLYAYEELKSSEKRKSPLSLKPFDRSDESWKTGMILAEGQNLVRTLMETPSNMKFPPVFAERIAKELSSFPSVSVKIHDEKWIEGKGMGAVLAVARGSNEPARLVEISYRGDPDNNGYHAAVVGKGVTFDTGGISIKPSLNLDLMRGDMGGAACTASAIRTAAELKLPVNILGVIPITENMPGGRATRPGDVVRAMNGKTIQIDNTDAEGRLILADALCYAQEFNPAFIMDIATLTGAIRIALAGGASGVYSNNSKAWDTILAASIKTGDRVWRMPLFKYYANKMTDCHLADINNIGGGGLGGSCTAAGFLSEFIKKDVKWMHLDIASVSDNKDDVSYMRKGFSGRPLRTVVEFLKSLATEKL